MEMKWLVAAGLCLALLIAGFAGATLFPKEVVVKELVEVPVEVTNTVEVEKIVEVTVRDTEREDKLEKQLAELIVRYEQLADEKYLEGDVRKELAAISKAKSDFVDYEYLLLFSDYALSDLWIEKYYDERVELKDVDRIVDGKRVDYEQAIVRFEIKAAYEDDEGREYRRYAVKMKYDIDSDGDEKVEVDLWLV